MKTDPRRAIPSVDSVLRELGEIDLPRPVLLTLIRRQVAELRKQNVHAAHNLLAEVRAAADDLLRSPLPPAAVEALRSVATAYTNLEYDLSTGDRGWRAAYVEHNLAVLCGA